MVCVGHRLTGWGPGLGAWGKKKGLRALRGAGDGWRAGRVLGAGEQHLPISLGPWKVPLELLFW